MAAPLVYQELGLSGDKVSSGVYAEGPQVLLGQYDEVTVYVQFETSIRRSVIGIQEVLVSSDNLVTG